MQFIVYILIDLLFIAIGVGIVFQHTKLASGALRRSPESINLFGFKYRFNRGKVTLTILRFGYLAGGVLFTIFGVSALFNVLFMK